jgi:Sigma-70 region 2
MWSFVASTFTPDAESVTSGELHSSSVREVFEDRMTEWFAERFEENRAHLRRVAYRMLGSVDDAEDAVQEAWLRFSRSENSGIENIVGGSQRLPREFAWTCCAHAA